MSRLIVVAAVCGLVGAVNSMSAVALAATPVRAEEIQSNLLAGESVLLADGTTIKHELVLTARHVRGALVCKRCTFNGGISARDARFAREIDLSGSTVRGPVNLENATFSGPVRFGPSDRVIGPPSNLQLGCSRESAGALFMERINFAFSTFEDDADFEQTTFCEQASFASARFRAAARFSRSDFRSDSLFPGVAFDHEALFARANLAGTLIDFRAARFGGVADFHQATLAPIQPERETGRAADDEFPITFEDAVFRDRADFSKTNFLNRTNFRDSRMAADGVFRSATVSPPADGPVRDAVNLLSFDSVILGGELDFGEATLGLSPIRSTVEIASLSATGLSFHEATLVEPLTLRAHNVSLHDLEARLDQLDHVEVVRDRIALLRVLESSAKAKGDLQLANNAHYRLQELSAKDDRLPQRVADFALYQYVAGYLVRPEIPFVWLIFLVFVATIVRACRLILSQRRAREHEANVKASVPGEDQPRPADAPPNTEPEESRPRESFSQTVLSAFELTVGWREPSLVRRAELLVYALLTACILIALANTNPTLRNMIDAIQ